MGVIALSVEPLELAPDDRLDNEAITSYARNKKKKTLFFLYRLTLDI